MVGRMRCVVIHVKCDPNRLRGYGGVGVENGPFLLLWPVAYTTACTTVQAVICKEIYVSGERQDDFVNSVIIPVENK